MAQARRDRLTPDQHRRLSKALDAGLEVLRGRYGQDFTFAQWSKKLGRAKSFLSNAQGHNNIGPKTAREIARMLGEPEAKWLELTGHLRGIPEDAREAELEAIFTGLGSDLKDMLIEVAKSFRQYQMKRESTNQQGEVTGSENGKAV